MPELWNAMKKAKGNRKSGDLFIDDQITFQGDNATIRFEEATGALVGGINYLENSIRITPTSGNPAGKGFLVVSASGGTATANARIGIGTETPSKMLTVGGDISASG